MILSPCLYPYPCPCPCPCLFLCLDHGLDPSLFLSLHFGVGPDRFRAHDLGCLFAHLSPGSLALLEVIGDEAHRDETVYLPHWDSPCDRCRLVESDSFQRLALPRKW